jgi:hypothetical protein
MVIATFSSIQYKTKMTCIISETHIGKWPVLSGEYSVSNPNLQVWPSGSFLTKFRKNG